MPDTGDVVVNDSVNGGIADGSGVKIGRWEDGQRVHGNGDGDGGLRWPELSRE